MKKLGTIILVTLCLILGVGSLGVFTACMPDINFNENGAIQVVVRPTSSGTRGAMRDLLEKTMSNGTTKVKGDEDQNKVFVCPTTAAVLTKVSSEPQAIGYDSLGFLDDSVKKITVDGKEANVANIKSGDYFLARPLRVLYPNTYTGNDIKAEFLKFLKSKDAQQLSETEGYFSNADDISALAEYSKNNSMTGTTVKLTGSTSLQPLMKKLADKFKTYYTGVNVDIGGNGSGDGYACAGGGFTTADFGMISDKIRKTGATNGESAEEYTVTNDGIAIIVNKKNPIENITKAQLQDLFFTYAGDDTNPQTFSNWKVLIDANK